MAALVRTIVEQPDAASVQEQYAHASTAWEAKFPDAAEHLAGTQAELLAVTAFPPKVWRQIWSNNPHQRLNKEIRRRTDVVGVFPRPGLHHPPDRSGSRRTGR